MPQIRIGGVHGVGKTTLIDASLESLRTDRGLLVERIKGSLIMAEILGVHPDCLPEVPEELRHAAREKMYAEIARKTSGVRDAHFSVLTAGGEYEFPRSETDAQCVGALAVVTADPFVISKRRAELGRSHRTTDVEAITAHQAIELDAAMILAQELGVPLYTIDNSGCTIDEAVSALSDIIVMHSPAPAS